MFVIVEYGVRSLMLNGVLTVFDHTDTRLENDSDDFHRPSLQLCLFSSLQYRFDAFQGCRKGTVIDADEGISPLIETPFESTTYSETFFCAIVLS